MFVNTSVGKYLFKGNNKNTRIKSKKVALEKFFLNVSFPPIQKKQKISNEINFDDTQEGMFHGSICHTHFVPVRSEQSVCH